MGTKEQVLFGTSNKHNMYILQCIFSTLNREEDYDDDERTGSFCTSSKQMCCESNNGGYHTFSVMGWLRLVGSLQI